MRTLLLTLIVFAIAGCALIISQLGLPQFAQDLVGRSGTELSFDPEPSLEPEDGLVASFRESPKGLMTLDSGTPSQTATFNFPFDSRVIDGALEVNFSSQFAVGQNGILRAFINNELRAEILLRPGLEQRVARLNLLDEDLAHEKLVARFSLEVPEHTGMCGDADLPSGIVEISPESHLALNLSGPIVSARDKVALLGNSANLRWSHLTSQEDRKNVWLDAVDLTRLGLDVSFTAKADENPLTKGEVKTLLRDGLFQPLGSKAQPEWPEEIARFGNAGKRSFKRTTAWRHWFRTGQNAHQTAPEALEYGIFLGPLPTGAKWSVTTTVNGSIVETRLIAGDVGELSGRVDLANLKIEPSNLIEISATSTYEPLGQCNDGPDLFAELRPETRLVGGGQAIDTEFDRLRAELSKIPTLAIEIPAETSPIEARRMLDLAVGLVPEGTSLSGNNANTKLTFLKRADLQQAMQTLPEGTHLVWLDLNDQLQAETIAVLKEQETEFTFGAIVLAVPQMQHQLDARLKVENDHSVR